MVGLYRLKLIESVDITAKIKSSVFLVTYVTWYNIVQDYSDCLFCVNFDGIIVNLSKFIV